MTRLDDLPDLITVADFQAWAGIGRRQAYAAVHRGDVQAVRLGPRSLRVVKASLEAFVNGTAGTAHGDAPAEFGSEGVEGTSGPTSQGAHDERT